MAKQLIHAEMFHIIIIIWPDGQLNIYYIYYTYIYIIFSSEPHHIDYYMQSFKKINIFWWPKSMLMKKSIFEN